MKCADPVLCYIERDTNKRLFRNWSLTNDSQKQTDHILFDCGKCIICRRKKSRELAQRCVLHASLYLHNSFLTLTYDGPSVGDNELDYTHIQKFKKRLRKSVLPKRIEIFNVHEYGKNGRKHWHLVVFNHSPSRDEVRSVHDGITLYSSKELEKLWTYGYNSVGDVSEASAMYQAQYTQKDLKNGNLNNSRKSKSNHSGIGKAYFLAHYRQILSLGYIPFGEQKMPVPRYFERLAHKHYSHFYEPGNFFDSTNRKRLYRPFKLGEEKKDLADLFIKYKTIKNEKIKEMESAWHDVITHEFDTKEEPEFIKSAKNALYELDKKHLTSKEKF